MEITGQHLVEKIDELKKLMATISVSSMSDKANVDKLTETFDASQSKVYKTMLDLITKLDRLFHANYDTAVAQALNVSVAKLAADAKARTDYLVEVDVKAKRLEMEGAAVDTLKEAENLRKSIVGLHMYLSSAGIEIPDSIYKKNEKGEFVLNKSGERVLRLPRVPKIDDETGQIKRTGRKARTSMLILGVVSENGETEWHDHDHIGKTFAEIFGTLRAEHNPVGLFKEVEKSNQSVTKGWETPVEYASHKWVAKVREDVNVNDVDDDDDDDSEDDDE